MQTRGKYGGGKSGNGLVSDSSNGAGGGGSSSSSLGKNATSNEFHDYLSGNGAPEIKWTINNSYYGNGSLKNSEGVQMELTARWIM